MNIFGVRPLCKMAISPFLRRPGLIGALIAVPLLVLLLATSPDMTSENALAERLADLEARLQQLDYLHRARREQVQVLSHHLAQFLTENSSLSVSPEVRYLLRNVTGVSTTGETAQLVRVPTIYHFLPHLLDNPASLRPAFVMSKGRTGVSMVLGIPSVKRDVQSYLLATLRNLLESMNEQEMRETLIVVLLAESDLDFVQQTANQIEFQFPEHVESGLIDVIAPHASYYPDFSELRQTFGDSRERVKWRSKQNLDMAFLMMYAQPRGVFYVQLEDDILVKKNCVSTMRTFALERIAKKDPWLVLVFCQLGFIGKLFKSVELPLLIQFLIMFYNDKPVDWLVEDLITTKACNSELNPKQCKKARGEAWVSYKPSLFQHIGTHSSLRGKVQKLKDKQFGKVALFFPHTNPPANAESAIKPYKHHTLQRAYNGDTFFWGLLPVHGDTLTFTFHSPVRLSSFLIRSGNAEHPSDKLVNTSVEVQPVVPTTPASNDGFVVVGQFGPAGIASGKLQPNLGLLKSLRLHVHSDSDSWVILSEIELVTEKSRR